MKQHRSINLNCDPARAELPHWFIPTPFGPVRTKARNGVARVSYPCRVPAASLTRPHGKPAVSPSLRTASPMRWRKGATRNP